MTHSGAEIYFAGLDIAPRVNGPPKSGAVIAIGYMCRCYIIYRAHNLKFQHCDDQGFVHFFWWVFKTKQANLILFRASTKYEIET